MLEVFFYHFHRIQKKEREKKTHIKKKKKGKHKRIKNLLLSS